MAPLVAATIGGETAAYARVQACGCTADQRSRALVCAGSQKSLNVHPDALRTLTREPVHSSLRRQKMRIRKFTYQKWA
jgi:hypothetical protein